MTPKSSEEARFAFLVLPTKVPVFSSDIFVIVFISKGAALSIKYVENKLRRLGCGVCNLFLVVCRTTQVARKGVLQLSFIMLAICHMDFNGLHGNFGRILSTMS